MKVRVLKDTVDLARLLTGLLLGLTAIAAAFIAAYLYGQAPETVYAQAQTQFQSGANWHRTPGRVILSSADFNPIAPEDTEQKVVPFLVMYSSGRLLVTQAGQHAITEISIVVPGGVGRGAIQDVWRQCKAGEQLEYLVGNAHCVAK